MKRFYFAIAVTTALVLGSASARAEETEAHPVGIGYKIGNGVGFLGGDVILRLLPHVVFDLQANYVILSESINGGPSQTITGYAFAPMVQFQLKSIGHTPYLGVGFVYIHESLDNLTASGTGLLINAGYEWRFASGVGVLVGAGIDDLGTVHATNGTTTIDEPGGLLFNIEAGVRYYF